MEVVNQMDVGNGNWVLGPSLEDKLTGNSHYLLSYYKTLSKVDSKTERIRARKCTTKTVIVTEEEDKSDSRKLNSYTWCVNKLNRDVEQEGTETAAYYIVLGMHATTIPHTTN